MQGLLYGSAVNAGHRRTTPTASCRAVQGADAPAGARAPDPPGRLGVAKTRLTGICGSDALMVFSDFGDDFSDSPLTGYFSFPTVLGHEVVADVVEVGRP